MAAITALYQIAKEMGMPNAELSALYGAVYLTPEVTGSGPCPSVSLRSQGPKGLCLHADGYPLSKGAAHAIYRILLLDATEGGHDGSD